MPAVRVAGCVTVAVVQDLGDVLLEHGVSQKDINMACDFDELVELAASRGAIKQATQQATKQATKQVVSGFLAETVVLLATVCVFHICRELLFRI